MTDSVDTPANTATDGDAPDTVTTKPESAARQMTFSLLDNGEIRADFGPGLDPLT